MKLSVIIPVYNELKTIDRILEVVQGVPVEKELVIVDDCSTDGTREKLGQMDPPENVQILFHDVNQGKGAAVRTGFATATGEIVIIQDADLEYDPAEYPQLIQPIIDGQADVVYGSRFVRRMAQPVLRYRHTKINQFLTWLFNVTSDLYLTDMETCYKTVRTDLVRAIELTENRFGFDPELTCKCAAAGGRFWEVAISYNPRTHEEGKKIGWRDGVRTIWCVLKFNLRKRYYRKLYRPRWKKED